MDFFWCSFPFFGVLFLFGGVLFHLTGANSLGMRLVHAGGVEEHVLGVRYGRAGHAP